MSPQRMYKADEKPYHEPRKCPVCGEQEETRSWSIDDRLVGTFYLPNDACTNPDCSRRAQAGPR